MASTPSENNQNTDIKKALNDLSTAAQHVSAAMHQGQFQVASAAPAPKTSSGARNFFFYFLQFALLYTVSISLGGILFYLINRLLPQIGAYDYATQLSGSLRYHLSALIIGTPIFLWLAKKIYGEQKKYEAVRQSVLRRWLTYITLILAALLVIGDLIALVYNLLGGELSGRFVLKIVVILIIAGSIFYYFLTDIQKMHDTTENAMSKLARIYFWGVSAVVVLTVIAGFTFIESPLVQRQRGQDNSRLNRLQEIDAAVYQYASVHDGQLPASLDQASLRAESLNDPITNLPFTYQIVDPSSYKLCAVFETSNKVTDKNGDYYDFYGPDWLHEKGEVCFDRSIDPLLRNQGIEFKTIPQPAA